MLLADPSPVPSSDPCGLVVGGAKDMCQGDNAPSVKGPADAVLNPLDSVAHTVADGAAWVIERVGKALDGSSTVDFTSLAFLQQYAVVFAASTVLTLVLWLIAVAKRAMRGAPMATALGEAIGLLWLTVLASAFTPLILQVVISATDAVTTAMTGTDGTMPALFKSMADTLRKDGDIVGGGPIILIVVAGVTILAAGLLGLELVIRAAALYLGALLGVVVYTGLVDRTLWPKIRRWAGIMVALILLDPILRISLSIADVFTDAQGPDAAPVIVAGNAVIIIALAAGVAIFKFVPGYGDEIAAGFAMRATMGAGRAVGKVGASAAGVVAQGIQTHGGRPSEGGGKSNGGGGKINRVNGVSDGISTHGNRGPGKQKKDGD
uniref:Integral membrane protein n=1 Tax=Streptomyces sp. NBC_00093 TaxID=2975649 RepID=A0AAU2AJK1_9ACTN